MTIFRLSMPVKENTPASVKNAIQKLQRAIVDGLQDVKAQDIQVFNTEHLSPLFERVIIASGTSNRQTRALAVSVRDAVREAGFSKPRLEGEENGEWIIVDCGAAVAHIMQPAIRQYYALEDIWGEKPVRLKSTAAAAKKPARSAAAGSSKAKTAAPTPVKKAASAATPRKNTAKQTAPRKAATQPAVKKAPAAKKVAAQPQTVTSPSTRASKTPKSTPKTGAKVATQPTQKATATRKTAAAKTVRSTGKTGR